MEREGGAEIRRFLPSAAVLAAIFLLSLAGLQPPKPKPDTAPTGEFSAARALEVLGRIEDDEAPHPIGSAADAAIRGRVLEEFKRLGYDPQEQTAFACSAQGTCATVHNVLARLDGADAGPAASPDAAERQPAVLLAAHYDSVPAGPGASDDGTGVAVELEIARALTTLPRPRHSIIFLADEGEEAGLLGARAFVLAHPWAKDVRAAVNLDARGTSGPSLMFETGSANEWVVRLYKEGAARPAASSIFYSVYKRLPNDTDFSIFKLPGWQGLNFAFIGGVAEYHTPLDNLANVSAASVQHQGENALAAMLALANADIANPRGGEAVYFDIFERAMVVWRAKRGLEAALGVALMLLLEIGWMVRSKRLLRQEFRLGLRASAVIIAATGVLALGLQWVIWLAGGMPVNWVAHPLPLEIAFWALPVVVIVTHGLFSWGRAGFWGMWAAVWTWWTLAAVVTALLAPGVSYVALVPTGVAVIAGLPFIFRRTEHFWSKAGKGFTELPVTLPLAAAAVVGFAPALLLYDALGNRALVLIAVVVGLLLTPALPLWAGFGRLSVLRRLGICAIPIAVTALAAFASTIAPAYSAKSPERMNMRYWLDADSGASQWVVQPASGHLREAVRVAAAFHRVERGPFPWDTNSAFVAEAPHLDLAAPTFTILESSPMGAERSYSTLLRSERGAPDAMVLFSPGADAQSVEIEGQPVEAESGRSRRSFAGWTAYECVTMPAEGVLISFTLPIGKSVEVYVVDRSYGLPPDGEFLLKARPLTATPSQDGDLTIVSRSVQLIP
ncbi:MAG: M28 family peptidase [Candidatus Acidiferrales bacterium]